MEKDTIYSLPLGKVGDFKFDDQVAQVFPDMISRSVPGYGSILSMIGELAARYAQANSNIYDLGCSLGACSQIMRARVPQSCTLHAIDSSQSMIDEFRKQHISNPQFCSLEIRRADIRKLEFENASFSVLNFTLQFILQKEREALLSKVFDGTLEGGALVLSEKIAFPNSSQQDLLSELHHSFKRANGYSELEIAQKRSALEKTLIPETLETHISRLQGVGFKMTACWFQCFNFVSILAVK